MAASEPRARRLELWSGLGYNLLEWDADSDHTVILVHGFLDMAWGWAPMVRDSELLGRCHIVAPDMRGHGDSDRVGPGGYYHFMDYVADLIGVIDQVGRERVSLVGHSMGGAVVSYTAGAFPERVEKLAVLEGLGPPETSIAAPDRVRGWIEAWKDRVGRRAGRTYASLEDAAARLRKADDKLGEELARELALRGTTRTPDGYCFKHDPLHLTRGPYPFLLDTAMELWERVSCPVMLVEGGESPFSKLQTDRERRYGAFPGARIETLDGAGHMMQRHRPGLLGDLLADFLLT